MTPEEQNVAIAEWLGVKFHKPSEGEIKSGSYYQYEPNYCGDLNAMHEAEEKLRLHEGYFKTGKGSGTTNVWSSYRTNLNRLLGGTWTSTVEAEIFHATAAQRAEALLRSIGKWEEKK